MVTVYTHNILPTIVYVIAGRSDTPWFLSYYSEQDKISAEAVITRLGIKNASVFEFKEPIWDE